MISGHCFQHLHWDALGTHELVKWVCKPKDQQRNGPWEEWVWILCGNHEPKAGELDSNWGNLMRTKEGDEKWRPGLQNWWKETACILEIPMLKASCWIQGNLHSRQKMTTSELWYIAGEQCWGGDVRRTCFLIQIGWEAKMWMHWYCPLAAPSDEIAENLGDYPACLFSLISILFPISVQSPC